MPLNNRLPLIGFSFVLGLCLLFSGCHGKPQEESTDVSKIGLPEDKEAILPPPPTPPLDAEQKNNPSTALPGSDVNSTKHSLHQALLSTPNPVISRPFMSPSEPAASVVPPLKALSTPDTAAASASPATPETGKRLLPLHSHVNTPSDEPVLAHNPRSSRLAKTAGKNAPVSAKAEDKMDIPDQEPQEPPESPPSPDASSDGMSEGQ